MTTVTTKRFIVRAPQNAGGRHYGPFSWEEAYKMARETGGDILILFNRDEP